MLEVAEIVRSALAGEPRNHVGGHEGEGSVAIVGAGPGDPRLISVRGRQLLDAADVVVSMAGYNTICEILSLRKRAVIVPRVEPVKEQEIRATRMARLGLFKMIHPARLTPRVLMWTVSSELEALPTCPHAPASIRLDALPEIGSLIREMASRAVDGNGPRRKSFLARNDR